MRLSSVQIVIVCGLALFVLIVGIIVMPSERKSDDGQTPTTDGPRVSGIRADEKENIVEPILSAHRFDKRQYLKTDKKTKIQNSLAYFLYSPPEPWPEGIKFPLIIHLRDNNDTAFSAEYITQDKMAYNFPAFSLVPDIRNQYRDTVSADFKVAPDIQFTHNNYKKERDKLDYKKMREDAPLVTRPLMNLLEDLKAELPVNEQQIYVIGCGYGGATAYSLIENHPTLFASAVMINSAWDSTAVNKLARTPILMLNGDKNGIFSSFIAESLSKNINQAGGKAIFQEYESMPHTCSYTNLYSSKVWKWMFAQKRQ